MWEAWPLFDSCLKSLRGVNAGLKQQHSLRPLIVARSRQWIRRSGTRFLISKKDVQWQSGRGQTHFQRIRRRERPFGNAEPGLVSDEVREEVRQYPEQREATNAVSSQYPCSAAFVVFHS